ncbi:apoptosis-inducing factor 3 isoform X2 [Athalia rosae]|uniref:apoptosis-inducing factor 3 isoform X2 n=1 Tax=Athalia rosae TaxID=37344 RepID=UPI0020334BBC|nr:apoptosis-inducing factor 3 isoform X2 [Athalia rosae]XP_048506581.1 apoptosis-inducing factor 3 isoform X2 [Athalia rosae]
MGAKCGKTFSPSKAQKQSGEKSPTKSSKSMDLDYVEGVVCNENDIKDNEMKLLPLGEDGGKILLIKQDGELHAVGTKCSHYGALLSTGALGQGRVRCPWHGACFNIKTGDIEDYPGLDSLPCYNVSVSNNGDVKVRAKRKELETNKRTKQMVAFKAESAKTVVIVGGGPAGATCAETLRQEGFTGRIVMVCKESALPYDRPKVSKVIDGTIDKLLLRSQLFYDEHNIETLLGNPAIGLDTNRKIVKLSTNEDLAYDHLFIATGGVARWPDVPGVDLANIFVMREFTDSAAVYAQIGSEKHVVVLGLGFVGMEAAAYCVGKCASVTVVGRDSAPFKAVYGEEIGLRIKQEFEQKGVRFILDNTIARFIPKDDGKTLNQVELKDGTYLECDMAILGIGCTFSTDWLKETQLQLRPDGTIATDKYLQTNVENIYAGGDIAYAPVFSSKDLPAAIGHYGLAHYHGKIAALNICGKETPLRAVPFFWTMLFGKSYRYAGHGRPTGIKILGSLENFKFFAYYFKAGKVIAMSSVGRDPIVADFANLLYQGRELTEEEVENDPFGWMTNKPKDLLPAASASENKSNGLGLGNLLRRNYHTHPIVPQNVRQIKNSISHVRHVKQISTYFRMTKILVL